MNVVITGAGRGLGLGFVNHYLAQQANVWACFRTQSEQLSQLQNEQLRRVQWDVTEAKDSAAIKKLGLPDRIDLLINNAGIYGPSKADGQSLEGIDVEAMQSTFNVNCIGPLNVVKALMSRLIAAQGKIANVSSKMGSSDDNTSGGCYAYRASKAALVMVSKSMAIDLEPEGVRVITLHPGWVRTDMTNNCGRLDVETSVDGMTKVIDHIEKYSPGTFVAFDGKVIPY